MNNHISFHAQQKIVDSITNTIIVEPSTQEQVWRACVLAIHGLAKTFYFVQSLQVLLLYQLNIAVRTYEGAQFRYTAKERATNNMPKE